MVWFENNRLMELKMILLETTVDEVCYDLRKQAKSDEQLKQEIMKSQNNIFNK